VESRHNPAQSASLFSQPKVFESTAPVGKLRPVAGLGPSDRSRLKTGRPMSPVAQWTDLQA
jgi:hypothetical protein